MGIGLRCGSKVRLTCAFGIPTTLTQSLWSGAHGNSNSKGSGGQIASLTGPGGHALDIGLLRKEDVPTHIPKYFDWAKLQSDWSQGKAHGSTASAVAEASTASDAPPNATEAGLTTAENNTEKKQPEDCEKDPKSMETSEESNRGLQEGSQSNDSSARGSPGVAWRPKDNGGAWGEQ